MNKPSTNHSTLRDLERLLAVSSRLPRRTHPRPDRAEFVDAVAGWVRGVAERAEELENELAKIFSHRVDPVELGRQLHFAAHRDPFHASVGSSKNEAVAALLITRIRRAVEPPSPVVWVLGQLGESGIELFEEVGAESSSSEPPSSIGLATSWRPIYDGTWQLLDYPAPEVKDFLLCVYWRGEEDVSVTSRFVPDAPDASTLTWTREAWKNESGEILGWKFCQTLEFSNISGKALELTVTLGDGTTETSTILVDNLHVPLSEPGAPGPILTPRPVKHPPQGPDPISIPALLAALPPSDPSKLQDVFNAFARFTIGVEQSLPRSVQETMRPELLRENSGALDYLMRAVGEQFDPPSVQGRVGHRAPLPV